MMAITIPVLMAVGCNSGVGSTAPAGIDSITINSISPSIVSTGTTTAFTISVSYSLRTKQSGIINYSFQSGSSAFALENDAQPVSKGSGTLSFTVTKTPTEMNTVRVLLSDYPHPLPWSPLAMARQTIAVNSSDSRTARGSRGKFFAGRFSQPSRP
jgi:hypothetical protein